MAVFNPDAQISDLQTRDQTGASRGTGTNRTFEALFKGLGDTIGNVTTVADTAVQNKIEKDARYGFESTNDEMNLSTDTAPPEIIRSGEGLQKLADAHLQGRVSQEYYYGRLAASLKGLRAKYPGYEKEVDAIVQNVTGTRPANAYRDALFSSVENLRQQQATSAGKWDSWAGQKENSEVLGILYPDFHTNPEKYASEEARQQVRSNVSQYQGRIRIADDTVKLQSSDKAIAKPQVGRLFSTIVNGRIVGGANATNVDQPNVQNMMSSALADGKIDPAEKDNIMGFLAQVRVQTEADLRNRVASSDWGSNFTSQEINEEINNALEPIKRMEALVTSDDISSAAQIAARNKAITDQATLELYEKFPELQTASALRGVSEVAADKIVLDTIDKHGGGNSFINKTLGKDLSEGVITGKISMSQVTERVAEAGGKTGKEKEGLLSQVLDSATSYLTDPRATPEVKRSTVQSVYGDNLDATWGVVDDSTGSTGTSQRMRLFTKMFNPEITKQVASLNDPEALRTYTAAAVDKFQQIPEFRAAAADLQTGIEWNKYARVNYDEQRNRLVVEVNDEAFKNAGFFQRSDQGMWRNRLVKMTNSFNQALTLMAPIIEAEGGDEIEGVKNLTNALAVDLQGGHKEGFLWYINDSIDSILQGRVNPDGGTAKPGSKLYEAGKANVQNQTQAMDPNFTGEWTELGDQSSAAIEDDDVQWSLPDGELPVEAMPYAPTDRADETPFDSVLRAGRGWTEIQRPDGTVVRRTGSRNWRNNNPGNIEFGKFAKQHGALGTDGRFAVFPTYEAGRKAKEVLLFESPGYRTKDIAGAINRYAPPFENDTDAYANAVAKAVGVPVDTPVADLTPSQRERMLDAMERVEGFRVGREVAINAE